VIKLSIELVFAVNCHMPPQLYVLLLAKLP